MKDLGRWDDRIHKPIYDKIEAGEDLNASELSVMMQPLKPFYYNRYRDSSINMMTSRQIKTSVIPLIPQLVTGTEMEPVANWMNKTGEFANREGEVVDDLYFESASKVGTRMTSSVADNKGKLRPDFADSMVIETLDNNSWGIQLDVPDHLKDTTNKLGVQIAKIIFGNLSSEAIYELDGVKMTGDQLREAFFDTIIPNIIESSNSVLADLGYKPSKDLFGTGSINVEKVQEILLDELKRTGSFKNLERSIKTIPTADVDRDWETNL